jgi:glycosyltransferase involved in cell wall biosynthesis
MVSFKKLNWYGPVNEDLGYGVASIGFVKALEHAGKKVHFSPTEPIAEQAHVIKKNNLGATIHENKFDPAASSVYMSIAPHFESFRSKKKMIGFTMLENDQIPQEWVESINHLDACLTPSTWGVEVFKKSGVKVPVYAQPLGVDTTIFNPLVAKNPQMKAFDNHYKFLAIGKFENRKGYDQLFRAFAEEFGDRNDVVLFVMADNPFTGVGPLQIMAHIGESRLPARPQIVPIGRFDPATGKSRTRQEVAAVVAGCDAFVLPSRGEGWGLPYAEAMACGLPTIGTAWSAMPDFMNDDVAYMIDSTGLEVTKNNLAQHWFEGGSWATPNYDSLKKHMRYVFENRDEARKKGMRAAKHICDNFSNEAVGKKLIKNIGKIESGG